jgi:hypothetical protein
MVGTANLQFSGAAEQVGVCDDLEPSVRHYSTRQLKRLNKRIGVLGNILGGLRKDLQNESLKLSDLQQLPPVVLAPVLNARGRTKMIACPMTVKTSSPRQATWHNKAALPSKWAPLSIALKKAQLESCVAREWALPLQDLKPAA